MEIGGSRYKEGDGFTLHVHIFIFVLTCMYTACFVYFSSPMCNREYKFFQPKVRWGVLDGVLQRLLSRIRGPNFSFK